MSQSLRLRAATAEGRDLLLEWRNDSRTRMASQQTTEVQRGDHLKWFANSLRDTGSCPRGQSSISTHCGVRGLALLREECGFLLYRRGGVSGSTTQVR